MIVGVMALRKSGHHAVINWLSHNMQIPYITDFAHISKRNLHILNDLPQSYMYNREDCTDWSSFQTHPPTIRILVLRDFYNWVASGVKAIEKHDHRRAPKNQRPVTNVEKWKIHAHMFLEAPSDLVLINFNEWFTSEEYRQQLGTSLGFKSDDSMIHKLGSNSSFGVSKNEEQYICPSGTTVRTRYKLMEHDSGYITRVEDAEAIELNAEIFGTRSVL